jgi:hypothetical protein
MNTDDRKVGGQQQHLRGAEDRLLPAQEECQAD